MEDLVLDTIFAPDLDDQPLTILVGSSLRKVVVSSLAMRRALRYVADVNIENSHKVNSKSGAKLFSAKVLKLLLTQTLLNVVTFQVKEVRSTQALRHHLDSQPLQLEGESTFWDLLRDDAINRGGTSMDLRELGHLGFWIGSKA